MKMLPVFLLRVQCGTVSMVETASRAPPFTGRVMVVLATMDSLIWTYDLKIGMSPSWMYTYWTATLCCFIIHPFFFKCYCISDSSHDLFRRASSGARFLQCLRRDFWKSSRWTLWVWMLKLTFKNRFLPHIYIFWRKHGGKFWNDYGNNWRSQSFLSHTYQLYL